jgi:hypothetical protein
LDFVPSFITNVRTAHRRDIRQYLEAYDLRPRFAIVPKSRETADLLVFLTGEFKKL